MTDRERLIRAVRRDRAAGMTRAAITRKRDVSPGFVDYHTGGKEYEHARQRRDRERRVAVECCVCGDGATVTSGALRKREREERGPYRCRSCQPGEARPIRDRGWLLPAELERPRAWARRVAAELGQDLPMVAAALDVEALREVDDSRPARHARMGHGRTFEVAA